MKCNHDVQYVFAQPEKAHAMVLYISAYIAKGGMTNLQLVALAAARLVSSLLCDKIL
jgi:hypothetical protein